MQDPSFLGRGWTFPPTFIRPGLSPHMVEGEALVEQSIRSILDAALGERVMQPDFGSLLADFMFSDLTTEAQEQLRQSVTDALVWQEPRIDLELVDVDSDGEVLSIRIDYLIRNTNTRSNLVYPFYLREALA
ncbi:GPW/gp25 family protein [Parachitinimonas caeni]|uniref:GPW/gp25 family protein n=1 Tax=Parachitinimonas caeni TaxID=3031301 RepID=A0ABT7DZI0_9NEIS|nr:GPW/gp25 family protein [Parachitinimonas caeni]MDK2125458.1 GPW/gp25 family protein [Parachitinimonas caeni]